MPDVSTAGENRRAANKLRGRVYELLISVRVAVFWSIQPVYNRWHFSAPATVLAMLALSHDPKDVFKNVASRDRKKALAGVRNAAWDLVYITAWHEKVQEHALTVLCSRDRVLLTTAELLRTAVLDGIASIRA